MQLTLPVFPRLKTLGARCLIRALLVVLPEVQVSMEDLGLRPDWRDDARRNRLVEGWTRAGLYVVDVNDTDMADNRTTTGYRIGKR